MPSKNEDLHGNVPDKSDDALLLIDVINDLEWPGGERVLEHALRAADRIAELKRRCQEARVPVVYVNDNFGRWQSDFSKVVDHCSGAVRGKPVAEKLRPGGDDYFVLKPKHSGFFSTTLDILLDYLETKRLIVAGLTGDNCVLFTANDAYMRDFHLAVPRDCVASIDPRWNEQALEQMERVLKADMRPSTELELARARQRANEGAARANPRSEARTFAAGSEKVS